MSSDRDTNRTPPDSRQGDDVYVKDEEGDPGLAGRSGDNEGVYEGFPSTVHRVADPKVYGFLLLIGLILLVFPEPITSTIGFVLILIGAFIGAIDFLSP
ncbi:hypothetical protein [Haladaptatus salinisoli]|uniref:hypothetical protein n=1 Tax=Haladaptatus salinisoli TaxID=2884876 RepID=UPI001D0AB9DF|nr:hypothetical protein [Haladaptatus salinisoli]